MILNGCTLNSGAVYLFPYSSRACSSRSRTSAVSGIPYLPGKVLSLRSRSSWEPRLKLKSNLSFGMCDLSLGMCTSIKLN